MDYVMNLISSEWHMFSACCGSSGW